MIKFSIKEVHPKQATKAGLSAPEALNGPVALLISIKAIHDSPQEQIDHITKQAAKIFAILDTYSPIRPHIQLLFSGQLQAHTLMVSETLRGNPMSYEAALELALSHQKHLLDKLNNFETTDEFGEPVCRSLSDYNNISKIFWDTLTGEQEFEPQLDKLRGHFASTDDLQVLLDKELYDASRRLFKVNSIQAFNRTFPLNSPQRNGLAKYLFEEASGTAILRKTNADDGGPPHLLIYDGDLSIVVHTAVKLFVQCNDAINPSTGIPFGNILFPIRINLNPESRVVAVAGFTPRTFSFGPTINTLNAHLTFSPGSQLEALPADVQVMLDSAVRLMTVALNQIKDPTLLAQTASSVVQLLKDKGAVELNSTHPHTNPKERRALSPIHTQGFLPSSLPAPRRDSTTSPMHAPK